MDSSSSLSSSLRPNEGAVPSIGSAALLVDFEAQQQWGGSPRGGGFDAELVLAERQIHDSSPARDDRPVMVEHVKGGPLSGMNTENEEGLPKAGSVLDGSDKTSQAAVSVHGGLKAKTPGEGLSDSCNIQMEVEDVPVSTDDGFRPAVKRRVGDEELRQHIYQYYKVEELSVGLSGGGKFKMLGIAPCSNHGDVKGRAGKKVVRRMKQ
ncbi:hypothetical protein GUJ93_ZPchr0007g3442 [Zizania palustris]|uniref:Uncharacterized protein n=1 Tax=Zizania palustris TaxID=103762 RepID=A0A8J5T3Y1_ZIZPA|nr:hypothetical protein GUJ93_ZPchr0007g3442 [Zizania palustris]